jgi:hypothetical protein
MTPSLVGSFAAAYAGLIALSLAMDRHYRQLCPHCAPPSAVARHFWRTAGWGLLALSVPLALRTWGESVGIVVWFGVLSTCLLLLVGLLAYRPRWARRLAMAAGGLLCWSLLPG